jgi:hypothetical protein
VQEKGHFPTRDSPMNPRPIDPLRPLGEPPSLGDGPLSQLPMRRVFLWSLFALLVIAGVALYFLYGDFVAPVLV